MLRGQFTEYVEGYNTHGKFPTKEWEKNTETNINKITKASSIWNLEGMYLPPNDKAIVLVGASPCLERDADKLKECNDFFRIFCVNSALKYLLERGIKPDFVVALDSDTPDISDHLDVDSKDLTLITTNIISPKVLDNWKGKIWFMPYYSLKDKKLKKRLRNKLGKIVPPGGNAFNTTLSFVAQIFGARIFILVASECCYDKKYYASNKIKRSNSQPVEWYIEDLNGKRRVTTNALHIYKLWLEMAAIHTQNWLKIIDTSQGILGVDKGSRIYTYELAEVIQMIKDHTAKKREVIQYAQNIMRDAALYTPQSYRRVPSGVY